MLIPICKYPNLTTWQDKRRNKVKTLHLVYSIQTAKKIFMSKNKMISNLIKNRMKRQKERKITKELKFQKLSVKKGVIRVTLKS